MNIIVNTDGASRGNPGPASIGFVIKEEQGQILHQEGKCIGITTNNVAEYSAVLKALRYIKEHLKEAKMIKVYMDSQLVARQLSGLYKIKNSTLKPLFDQIKILQFDLGTVEYIHIPRAENFLADRMANKALDEQS